MNLDNPSHLFGKKLHEQVEDRLKFYDSGEAPKKNIDAMKEVLEELNKSVANEGDDEGTKKKKKKKKDRKSLPAEEEAATDVAMTKVEDEEEAQSGKKKKQKKKMKIEGMEFLLILYI